MIQRCILFPEHVAAIGATPTPGQKNLISESKLNLFFRNQNRLVDLMVHRTCQAVQTLLPLSRGADHQMAEIPKAEHKCLPDILPALRLTDL